MSWKTVGYVFHFVQLINRCNSSFVLLIMRSSSKYATMSRVRTGNDRVKKRLESLRTLRCNKYSGFRPTSIASKEQLFG